MNRLAPCEVCGCPTLFHTESPDAPGRPPERICAECTRRLGREQRCGPVRI